MTKVRGDGRVVDGCRTPLFACVRRHQTVVDTHKIHAEVSEAFSRELFVSHT
jgi:hypothetical protein